MTDTTPLSTPLQVLYDDPEGRFTLSFHLELINDEWRTRVHFDVFYWRASTMRELDRIFEEQRARLPRVISAVLNHRNPVGPKFMTRFGFVPLGAIPWPGSEDHHTFWIHVRSK